MDLKALNNTCSTMCKKTSFRLQKTRCLQLVVFIFCFLLYNVPWYAFTSKCMSPPLPDQRAEAAVSLTQVFQVNMAIIKISLNDFEKNGILYFTIIISLALEASSFGWCINSRSPQNQSNQILLENIQLFPLHCSIPQITVLDKLESCFLFYLYNNYNLSLWMVISTVALNTHLQRKSREPLLV